MAKVGSIKSYHNGAVCDVADIYDQKINSVYQSPVNSDDVCCLHFNPTYGVIDECNNTGWNVATEYEITAENSKFDYAYKVMDLSTNTGIRAVTPNVFTVGSTDFTIDGYYYIDENSVEDTKGVQFYYLGPVKHTSSSTCCACGFNKKSARSEFIFTYGRIKSGSTYYAYNAGNFYIDNENIFNRTFHLACVYNSSTGAFSTFLDGVLQTTRTPPLNRTFTPSVAIIAGFPNGLESLGVYCSCFRYSKFARWTENFTPPSVFYIGENVVIRGAVPIRHNNQTYYAPLVTEAYKKSPCIAVRHNNQTYYTVKS